MCLKWQPHLRMQSHCPRRQAIKKSPHPSVLSEDANSGCPTCLTYVRQEQVIVGNLAGHLQLWDLATPDRRPAQDLAW